MTSAACSTASSASALETRKQTDPNTSGDQTSRFDVWVVKWWYIPKKVVMLKNSVPANWTPVAQTYSPSPHATLSCSNAAVVKKIEPTK
jgi:hypothetical protein